MHGCLDSLGHRIAVGMNFCTNCGEVFSTKRKKSQTAEQAVSESNGTRESRQLAAIAEEQGNICFYCEEPFMKSYPYNMTFDHVVPKSKGGQRSRKNGVASCYLCNTRKGSFTLQQWVRAKHCPRTFPLRLAKNLIEIFLSV